MKNLLLSAFFVLAVSGTASAHDYPGETNEFGQTGYSLQAEEQSSISNSLAYRICQAVQPYTEMTTAQLYEGYQDGVVVITYIGTDPADSHKSVYRVSVGGGVVINAIIDEF